MPPRPKRDWSPCRSISGCSARRSATSSRRRGRRHHCAGPACRCDLEEAGSAFSALAPKIIGFGGERRLAGSVAYEDLISGARDERARRRWPCARRPVDADVYLRHDRQPQRRHTHHGGGAMLSLMTDIELGLQPRRRRRCLSCRCVMPIRSLFRRFLLLRRDLHRLQPQELRSGAFVRTFLATGIATFTSLVPTHYA